MKIEVGDTVKFKENISLRDLTKTRLHITNKMLEIIGESTVMTVKNFDEDGDVEVKENDFLWSPNWLKIVEKAPKTLYFDARKTDEYRDETLDENDVYIWNHGCTREEIGEVSHLYSLTQFFTTEKPMPLEIIDGVVR